MANIRSSSFSTGTAAVTVSPPSGWQVDDIFLLLVETANQAVATPAGYTPLDTPQGTGTAAGATSTRLTAFWKRAGSVETSVTVADAGDHTTVFLLAFYACIKTGNPFAAVGGDVLATSSTTATIPSLTTTAAGCLVVLAVAHPTDTTSNLLSSITSPLVEAGNDYHWTHSTQGNGGGIYAAFGWQPNAGPTGTSNLVFTTSAPMARMAFALIPSAETPSQVSHANLGVVGAFLPEVGVTVTHANIGVVGATMPAEGIMTTHANLGVIGSLWPEGAAVSGATIGFILTPSTISRFRTFMGFCP